jgi:hypothetical protein
VNARLVLINGPELLEPAVGRPLPRRIDVELVSLSQHRCHIHATLPDSQRRTSEPKTVS